MLNGDTFELLQSATADCQAAAAAPAAREAEALARLERVLTAHAAETRSACGVRPGWGSNRIVFVPGDHDAALLLPSGRPPPHCERSAAPTARVEDRDRGYWVSADGRLVAEHGHQIGSSAHRFDGWPSACSPRQAPRASRAPGASRPCSGLYNRLETAYPIVDNVAQSGAGIKFALAADPALDVAAPGA